MRHRTASFTLATALSLAGAPLAGEPSPGEPSIGDPAPEIRVSKWLKGEPFDLASAKGNQITVLEFWASW